VRLILRLIAIAAIVLAAAAVAFVGIMFSRYVETRDADLVSATREFEEIRSRFADDTSLIECRFLRAPSVRSNLSTVRPIKTLHVLAFSHSDESLRYAEIPIGFLRLVTFGGRRRLMDMCGDGRHPLTLDDLAAHGPGLVMDVTGSAVQFLAASDALFGTQAAHSRMLIWTE